MKKAALFLVLLPAVSMAEIRLSSHELIKGLRQCFFDRAANKLLREGTITRQTMGGLVTNYDLRLNYVAVGPNANNWEKVKFVYNTKSGLVRAFVQTDKSSEIKYHMVLDALINIQSKGDEYTITAINQNLVSNAFFKETSSPNKALLKGGDGDSMNFNLAVTGMCLKKQFSR